MLPIRNSKSFNSAKRGNVSPLVKNEPYRNFQYFNYYDSERNEKSANAVLRL